MLIRNIIHKLQKDTKADKIEKLPKTLLFSSLALGPGRGSKMMVPMISLLNGANSNKD